MDSPVRYFSPEEMRALADKMQRRAEMQRIAHLTPASAWLCGGPRSIHPQRACTGKANAVVHLFEGIKSLVED